MQVKELIRRLQSLYNPDDHVAAHLWSYEDVLHVSEEKGVKLSKRAAENIIDEVDRHIDCELGITWVTIKCAIENYLSEKRSNAKWKKYLRNRHVFQQQSNSN